MTIKKNVASKEKHLPACAVRALAEADARRSAREERRLALKVQEESGGRGGLDPVRYDDWEIKGIARDF